MKEIPSFPVDKTIIIPWNIGLRSLREDHVKIPGGSSGRRRNSANSATRSFVFWAEKGPTRTFISGKRLPLPTSALNGSRDASAETGSPPVRTALQISLAIKRHPSPPLPLATESQENGSTRLPGNWTELCTDHGGSPLSRFLNFNIFGAASVNYHYLTPFDKYLATLRGSEESVVVSLKF